MATILIVDDEPINIELLHAYLDGCGHQLFNATSGEAALEMAPEVKPDLVLLDVMLPGISGFETAEKLKAERRDQYLPVILVTALNDHGSRIAGLRAGADEFLTKPVDRHELLIRIGNLLRLRGKEAALVQRNVELVELERFRDEMAALIVHDLKNPLTVMLANVTFATEDPGLSSDTMDALRDTKSAGQRALRLLANLLDVTKMESGRLQPRRSRTPVSALVDPILRQRAHVAEARNIAVTRFIAADAEVNADFELMSRVVENVVDNALRYVPSGGHIAVRATVVPNAMQLRVGNSGPPIPLAARARIFEKFGQAGEAVGRMNLGLGLYFCRLAAEAHGGRMWVEETGDLPTVFALEVPA